MDTPNGCSACKEIDLTTGAVDVNMYSIYSYFQSKGIPVICVKLSPKDLKENYLAHYIDGNESYFIHPGSKSIKLDNRVITVNSDKFTGYAIVFGDDVKNINSTQLTQEEMSNIQSKTNSNSISAIITACSLNPLCEDALIIVGVAMAWCLANPHECYSAWHHIICEYVDCQNATLGGFRCM